MRKYLLIFLVIISTNCIAILSSHSDDYNKNLENKFKSYLEKNGKVLDNESGKVINKEEYKKAASTAKKQIKKATDGKKAEEPVAKENNDSFIIIGPYESIEPYLPKDVQEKRKEQRLNKRLKRETANKKNKKYKNSKEYWDNYYKDESIKVKKKYKQDSKWEYYYK